MFAEIIQKDGELSYRTLAGANSDGLPIGTIIALHSNVVPQGFLPCNGVEFDIEAYPALYILLKDNHTPDLRECTLVGIGESERAAITNHDVYTLGQFKNDTVANPGFFGLIDNGTDEEEPTYPVYSGTAGDSTTASTTTHGKQYGINWAIKATTGVIAVADPEIYDQVVAFLTEHYIQDDIENLTNGCLIKYDKESNKFVPVTNPTKSNQVLSVEVESTDDWSFNGKKYDKDISEVENEESPSETSVIGKMTTDKLARTNRSTYNLYKLGDNYYDKQTNAAEVNEKDYNTSSVDLASTVVYYEEHGLYQYLDAWYPITSFNSDVIVLGDKITDTATINALNALTKGVLTMYSYLHYDWIAVTEFTSTGLVGDEAEPDWTLTDSDFLPVTYNLYYGSDFDYKWTSESNSKGIAFIGTREEYEVAKLIVEGQEGFIPAGSQVIITDEQYVVKGKDNE